MTSDAFWAGAHAKLAAQTTGELEASVSAPGLGSRGALPAGGDAAEHVVRGPGNQGKRGVPEWLRYMSKLPSPATRKRS